MKIDVIIPTYKPDKTLFRLIEMLDKQTVGINKIIIMNTEEKYLDNLFYGHAFSKEEKLLEIHNITKYDFDHGKTRNAGAKYSDADILVFMTQDAVPKNNRLIEELIKPFKYEEVGASYGRQIADSKATLAEVFSREFNYPDQDSIKSFEDIEKIGIKAFFCSNVCAAYRSTYFNELGGFIDRTIFNEDMIYANKLLKSGKKIAYASKAEVIHSHNYNGKQQFSRNFDLAVSQKMNPDVFDGISSESEGVKYVKKAFSYFVSNKKPLLIVPFSVMCAYRLAGFKLGKKYDKLPRKLVMKFTMSPVFFKKYWDVR